MEVGIKCSSQNLFQVHNSGTCLISLCYATKLTKEFTSLISMPQRITYRHKHSVGMDLIAFQLVAAQE